MALDLYNLNGGRQTKNRWKICNPFLPDQREDPFRAQARNGAGLHRADRHLPKDEAKVMDGNAL